MDSIHAIPPGPGVQILTCRLLFLLFLPLPVIAQTVRPPIVQYKEKARSRFEIVNDTVFPLNVVLEPKSFSVSTTGETMFRPLDSQIRLKLSAMSFRIPPKREYIVFYEAKADTLPAWFTIYCNLTGLPKRSGLNIQLELPHTVYLLQKQPLIKEYVQIQMNEYHPRAKQVVVEVENTGPRLGRCLAVEVSRQRIKKTLAGFPLFPQRRRRLEIPWAGPEPPLSLLLRFQGFVLEGKIQQSRE